MKIVDVAARQILDSRGNPTVEVTVSLECGATGTASTPSGASVGKYEAHELRDTHNPRYNFQGVMDAVANVQERIKPVLIDLHATEQEEIDSCMIAEDSTPNKSSLGANAILATSLAVAHAAANAQGLPLYRHLGGIMADALPCPMMNIINGGAHAQNLLDIQEFLILPIGAAKFSQALMWGCEVYHTLKKLLLSKGFSTNLGDEGGFAPQIQSAHETLALLVDAIEQSGFVPGKDIALGLDVAASELYRDGTYSMEEKIYTAENLASYYKTLTEQYPIVSIEDPFDQEDWDAYAHLTSLIGDRVQIVGDDLFVTNHTRLKKGISKSAANAILIKPNQIGTLTETLSTTRSALRASWGAILSHRSGETCDSTIAHIAVATGCGQIKTGAPARGERIAKYNELLRIEEDLLSPTYAGASSIKARI